LQRQARFRGAKTTESQELATPIASRAALKNSAPETPELESARSGDNAVKRKRSAAWPPRGVLVFVRAKYQVGSIDFIARYQSDQKFSF